MIFYYIHSLNSEEEFNVIEELNHLIIEGNFEVQMIIDEFQNIF